MFNTTTASITKGFTKTAAKLDKHADKKAAEASNSFDMAVNVRLVTHRKIMRLLDASQRLVDNIESFVDTRIERLEIAVADRAAAIEARARAAQAEEAEARAVSAKIKDTFTV